MTSIFVGNLPFSATEADLRRAFERYGRVNSVRIMTDTASGRSRGFGFVDMPSLDDADEAATRMNGASICGRVVRVNLAHRSGDSSTGGAERPRRSTLLDSL